MVKAKQYNTKSLYFSDRITGAMDKILDHPFTIVEAPMGYGKTTAVKEHLNSAGVNVLWQTIYDSYASNFWSGFSQLFAELDSSCALSLAQLGLPNDSVSRQEALNLIEGVPLPAKTVIVIDDYHLLDNADIHNFIVLLVRNDIPNMYIVINTRLALFENLDELKLKGYAHHITKEDLELTSDDIAQYYKVCGIRLKPAEVDKLYNYTEGWISALYLFMLNFIKDGRFEQEPSGAMLTLLPNIYNLLEKVVYTPLPEETRDFLLTVCIFDKFTVLQAAYMWPHPNASALLDELAAINAFISYEPKIKTYHLHNILSNFLEDILDRKDKSYKQNLYQKAAQWYVKTGDYLLAMHYFYLSEDFDALLSTLEHAKSKNINSEHKALLIDYMEACPDHVKAKHHLALLIYLMRLFTFNEKELFDKTCGEFIKNINSDRDLDEKSKNQLLGEYELIQSFKKYNDIKGMSNHHKKACLMMSAPTAVIDEQGIWTFGSPSVLYLFYRKSGLLKRHVDDMMSEMPYYYKLTHGHGSGAEYVMLAEWYYNQGDFENAEISVHRALYIAQAKKQGSITVCAMFLQMRLALLRGDFPHVLYLLQGLRTDITQRKEYILLHTLDLCESYVYLSVNQDDKVPLWVANGEFATSRLFFPSMALCNYIYGKLLLVKGEYLKLIGITGQFNAIASIFPNVIASVYNNIHLAGANERIFRHEDAVQALREALQTALPDKLYMPFVENCAYVKPILEQLYAEGVYCDGIIKILELYTSYQQTVEQIANDYFTRERPQLSEREQEIALLAADGLTNKEISESLFISQNTVKTQLKRIFEKLGVNSRALLNQSLHR